MPLPSAEQLFPHSLPIFTAFLLFISSIGGFNLDLQSIVLHHWQGGGMFGFTVAQHRDRGVNWVLVGAPEAPSRQNYSARGGAVFRCSVDNQNECNEIVFDRTSSHFAYYDGKQQRTDDKSRQWLGASLYSSGPNGIVVACAPRYVYFSTNLLRREPVGTCFVARNSFSDFQEYSPCRTSAWGYHRQGFCQAGFSAVLTPDSRRLFIGAVGSWYWQGQVFSQHLLVRNELFSTKEGPAYDDDSYLGYSIAVGEFSGDKDYDVAVGMPRGNNLTGKVTLYTSYLKNLLNLTGEQLGSYFGYSVCAVDINTDGLDDIVVGAPFYSNINATDGSYETGRVYVFYQNEQNRFPQWHVLDGKSSRGRFGLALTTLNDINKDGFGDFAVGAPYAGSEGRGCIYIMHGSKFGVRKEPSQVICAEDLNPNLTAFGFSLSGGLDLDNNEYPDLIVGAYEKNQVAVIKTRPVVTITSSLNVKPEKINLDEQGCSLLDGTVVSCILIYTCLEYTGVGVPAKIEIEFITQLDVLKEKGSRVYFLTSEKDHIQNTTAILQKDSMYCKSIYIYIKSTIRDKLTPVLVVVNYSLVDQLPTSKNLKPILNQYIQPVLKRQVNIQKNCGKDNICIPDLQLTAAPVKPVYLMGSNEKLEIEVSVLNAGEDAFLAGFFLDIPVGIDYINIVPKESELSVSCSYYPQKTSILHCDVGNPLAAKKIAKFTVLLLPKYMNSSENEYEFMLEVNSTNRENDSTEFDNFAFFRVPVALEFELLLSGVSIPNVVPYNKTNLPPETKVTEDDIGPEIVHIYDVWNRGPSPIMEAEVYILWPTYTISGQHLLYLVEQPVALNLGRCHYLPNVNPLNLTIGTSKTFAYSSLNVVNLDDMLEEDNSSFTYQTKRISRSAEEFQRELSCGPTLCSQIYCTVHSLGKDDHAYFKIRSRLWTRTLKMLGFEELKISSKIITRIISLPYAVQPQEYDYKIHTINTTVTPADGDYIRKPVPWWIIIIAVCAGILLLSILILILWKVGFFKRKRPGDEAEREPLNKPERNGRIVNGDEFL